MDRLLLINIERRSAAPATTLRAIWATTDDLLAGRRRTDTEVLIDEPALLQRLAALVSRLVPPAAAVREGSATVVPDPDPAPAAGDGRRAA
jgi:hypothetical protein